MADLNLDVLVAENRPVYVRNNTKTGIGGMGNVVVDVVDKHGRSRAITVPPTRAPFPFHRYASKEEMTSWGLKSMIGKEALLLIDPAQAEKELADPRIMADLNRALKQENMKPFAAFKPEAKTEKQTEEKALRHGDVDNVHPRILNLIVRLDAKDIQTDELLVELDTLRDELTPTSLEYLVANTTGTAARWAERELGRNVDDFYGDDAESEHDADYYFDGEEEAEEAEEASPTPRKKLRRKTSKTGKRKKKTSRR